MLVSRYPSEASLPKLLARPELEKVNLQSVVREVFTAVEQEGTEAVLRYSLRWDGVAPENLRVAPEELLAAESQVDKDLQEAIRIAAKAIRQYHEAQRTDYAAVETAPGVRLWRQNRAIETVGLYVPGGSAPLFSSLLMTAIPAQIAGCRRIVLCTPPGRTGQPDPSLLYAASVCGVDEVYRVGGIQAVAAMAIGNTEIPKVDKIYGPGSAAVAAAKQYALEGGTAIDLPAGPSEVLVIAGPEANPAVLASDLLAQAEHGPDAQVVLVTWDAVLLDETERAIRDQLPSLPRAAVAARAMDYARLILVNDVEEALAVSNFYAPEHLIVAMENAVDYTDQILNAGSVFLGLWSPETAGDYATGGNHCLPTGGAARAWSGLSLADFQKQISFQQLSQEGLRGLSPTLLTLARGEGLEAHARAVEQRLELLNLTSQKSLEYVR